ncbi:hypothetical protein PVAND_005630 [Polypedilum vanderplanki]|uniref:C2H2-type domain-containing protein n=1 Tax=Polypedilum vanderplanki TaxID=319348 RepID=A0A9J6C1I2_POLVA|nr:hypothetical protein PVAND_005630 [Polypedilum vanderplanki]
MECFKENCQKKLKSIEEAKFHLREKHRMKEHGLYKCVVENCSQQFTKSSNFYRHLKHEHKNVEGISQVIQNQPTIQNSAINSPSSIFQLENHSSQKNLDIFDNLNNEIDNTETFINYQFKADDVFFKFLSFLHSKASLTKKLINEILTMVKEQIIDPILQDIGSEQLMEHVNNSFFKINSFYKFQKILLEKGKSSNAQQKVVSEKIAPVYRKGKINYDIIKETVSIMPIKQQIQNFLELPNVLNSIVNYMHKLKSETIISNYTQGDQWKQIRSEYNEDDIVIPCFLYHDDFEPDNPLSSNAGNNKIAAFYYSFPVIPQHLLSSPTYIFDALFFSSHLKNEYLKACTEPLIAVFKDLETNGITLNIDNTEKKIYIVVTMLLGDNLAVNEMLGFSKGFNATHYCRFCTSSKHETKYMVKENEDKIRSTDSYNNDFQSNSNGVIKECNFISLKYFHPVLNFEIDVMHDLFEGVARYDLALILQNLIYEKKFFDLQTFNELKQKFEYGEIEIGNLGKEILDTQIKNSYITMSASEMKTCLEILPIMIGHLVPERNAVWKLLLQLSKLSNNLFKTEFSVNDVNSLQNDITSYLERRVRIFGKDLKPKHHFLTHASKCITNSGPLKYLSCFVYEQRNRIIKHYAKVCFQRKNLPFSLSYKAAIKFNSILEENRDGFPSEIMYDDKNKKELLFITLQNKFYVSEIILGKIDPSKSLWSLDLVKYKSTTYKVGYYVAMGKLQNHGISCYKIIDILLNGNDIYLIGETQKIKYEDHYDCFFLEKPLLEYKILCFNDLSFYPFNLHENIKGKFGIKLKSI